MSEEMTNVNGVGVVFSTNGRKMWVFSHPQYYGPHRLIVPWDLSALESQSSNPRTYWLRVLKWVIFHRGFILPTINQPHNILLEKWWRLWQ